MVTARDVLILAVGFLLGVGVWAVIDFVRDMRWLGQERRKAERRKEDRNAL
jgi:hypothetical protein